MNAIEINEKFGFKNYPILGSINHKKIPNKTELMSIKEIKKLENSFSATGKYVRNEDMLDGFQRLTLFKIGPTTLW